MLIQFTQPELKSLRVQPLPLDDPLPSYLEEREHVWQAELEKVHARGERMWNGEIYTLQTILGTGAGHILLGMSSGEYKDVVFRRVRGSEYIARQYGRECLLPFASVDCVPLTMDGKFVFGVRGDGAMGGIHPLSIIGGGINKDEMEIGSFEDIRDYVSKEIREETAIRRLDSLTFYALLYQDNIYTFMFSLRLPVESADVARLHRDGEFSRLVAFDQAEIFDCALPITASFRRWRPHLHRLAALFQTE